MTTSSTIADRESDFDYTKIVKANCGLEIQWKPPQKSTWLLDFIKNTINMGLDFVPFIGPILQTAFSVGWALILDPDSALDVLREMAPGVDLICHLQELKVEANETKKFLPEGWEELKLSTPKRILKTTRGTKLEEGEADADADADANKVDDGSFVEMETSAAFQMTATILQMTGKPYVKVANDTEEGETLAENNEDDEDTDEESDGDDEEDVEEK
jgi:hypothetical protein